MTDLSLRHGIWVAVCDGGKALLLENVGDKTYPKLEMREVLEHDNPPTSQQGTGAPGRTFSPADGRRGTVEQSDFHALAQQAFLQGFAELIDRKVQERKIPALILVAPARSLAIMRESMTAATREVLAGTLDRDYVKLPLYEIERHLALAG